VRIDAVTSPTPLLNGGPRPGNSFVVPDAKLVYISVTKVACTSLRWMIADLAGEDLASFYPSLEAHQTRLMTVHRDRAHWKKTPQLHRLPIEQVQQISRDDGWFVFAVVRDPWSRLWSAWQSKFLVRQQSYLDRFADEPWFPRVPEKQQDVVDDFRTFVMARAWETNEQLRDNFHFLPQVRSTHPRELNYSDVYDLPDLSRLFADLHAHLRSLGMDRELYVPRANDTPLPLIRAALDNGVAEEIRDAYRDDFAEYGDRWSLETVKMQDCWTGDAIRHAAFHTVANQRLGDMRDEARAMRGRLVQAEARIAALEAQQRAYEALPQMRLRRAAGRVARRLGVRR
jgi:hypothetical protein